MTDSALDIASPHLPGKARVIDCHGHLVPPALTRRLLSGPVGGCDVRAASVSSEGRQAVVFEFPAEGAGRPMPSRLTQRDEILRWMDEQGIDVQIVSIWGDLFGYSLTPEQGASWHRFMNECVLEECADVERWVPLSTAPVQDGRRAAAEVVWARDAGFAGVTVGASPVGRELDDPDLEPFWEALAGTGLPVLVHPLLPERDLRLQGFGLANTVGRPIDTTIAAARLLCSGVLERHPGARVLLAHGGGTLPYIWGRLTRGYALEHAKAGDWGVGRDRRADPRAGLPSLHFDTVVNDPAALALLLAFAGEDRLLLGSDYPFAIGDHAPVQTLERVGDLAPTTRARVTGGNAADLFLGAGDRHS